MKAQSSVDPQPAPMALVEVIELKWLLAGEGLHLHVERMLADPAYARGVLDHAASARNPVLRAAVSRLRTRLGLD